MSNVISYPNFNANNVVLSIDKEAKTIYTHESYGWKKIVPKYKYVHGEKTFEDDIYIQIPHPVLSYGIKTFEGRADQSPSHSFSFVLNIKPTPENGLDDETADAIAKGTLKIFDTLLKQIKEFLKEDPTIIKLNKQANKSAWLAFVESIKPFYNYQKDKDTGKVIEGALPTLFAKLKTDKEGAIRTQFQEITPARIEEIKPAELPKKLQGVKCMAMGVLHIESIFVTNTNLISIQLRVHEVLIAKVLKSSINRMVVPAYLLQRTQPIEKIFDEETQDEEEDDEVAPVVSKRFIQRKKQ